MAKCYVIVKSGKRFFPVVLRNGQELLRDGEVAVVGERDGKFGSIRWIKPSSAKIKIEDHPMPWGRT